METYSFLSNIYIKDRKCQLTGETFHQIIKTIYIRLNKDWIVFLLILGILKVYNYVYYYQL